MAAASPRADIPRKSRRELCPVIAASFNASFWVRLGIDCTQKAVRF
jgi:hypothetical protein